MAAGAGVTHPDDADPPDRAASPDKRCEFLHHRHNLRNLSEVVNLGYNAPGATFDGGMKVVAQSQFG